jgi:hypothetical protein
MSSLMALLASKCFAKECPPQWFSICRAPDLRGVIFAKKSPV